MTGLDKIISQILEDAGKEAQEISEKAKSEADGGSGRRQKRAVKR